ncbi:MAG: DMT family transporter [Pseudomonadota bacterium]
MDLRALLMGLAFAFMWSSAFTSARIIVADAPPLAALSLRFLISGGIAIVLARAMGQSWRLTPAQLRATVIFGICQNALYLGLNFVAMQWIEASLASIIASSMPLIVAFAAWSMLGERLSPLGIGGLVAGFAGVALIMGSRLTGGADPLGIFLCIIGASALAWATLTLRNASSGGNVLMIVGLQMLVGSVALLPPAIMLETWTFNPTWPLAIAFTYTTLVPGLLATLVWFWLVRRIGATRAATFHFLNPFFGVAVAAVFLGEAMGWADFVGVFIIMAGILAVQRGRVTEHSPAPQRG